MLQEIWKRFGAWIRGQSTSRWLAFQAVQNLVNVVLTTVFVTLALSAKSGLNQFVFWALSIIAVILLVVLAGLSSKLREAIFPENPRMVLSMIRAVADAMIDDNKHPQPTIKPESTAGIQERICIYLRAFRNVIAQSWSIDRYGETTNMDVVIMTRAEDGFVTIGAWAGVKPVSLSSRIKNPQYYENTEAAKLYRQYIDNGTRAPILIIPNVSECHGYDHFGRDSLIRTKSTMLLPLYDSTSFLHGFVAVTTSKRENIFREEDRGFWQETWRLWEPQLVRHLLVLKKLGTRIGNSKL